jgi:2-keto-3-deoxy-L-rhamnonate aldolase RhmA
MRNSKTLAKIRAGLPVKVAYLGHYLPLFIGQAAHNGYEALWLDFEHRAMEVREAQSLIAFCHLYDIDPIVRPPTREKAVLYRFLEDGATGFIFPLVESADEARDLVSKVKFPPLGDRGLEGKGLDADFGRDTMTEEGKRRFVAHANQETLVIVQLESPQAVLQAEAMAAVEGVDGLFLGPTDFELRAAQQATAERMSWETALTMTHQAAQKHGKFWGVMPRNFEQVRAYTEQGARFVPWGLDTSLLIHGLAVSARELDSLFGG